MEDCIFCKIIKKEIPAEIVYEDSKTLAFLDISPIQKRGGHTLVVPKNHYETIEQLLDEDAKAVILTIKKLSKALLKFGEGLNVIQSNKKVAGQEVNHVHFHLVPRFTNDGIQLGAGCNHKHPSHEELKLVAEKIKKLL